ncbi:hypothetical protein ACWV26_02945 [Rummeliibacillus sp. JY-2-4R]
MLKKLMSVVLIGLISFVAGSYYTKNNPSTDLFDLKKNGVSLFASTPENINTAIDDLKIVITTSLDFMNSKIDNLLIPENDGSNTVKEKPSKSTNQLDKPVNDLQQIDVDHEDKEQMPASGGMAI